MLSLWQDLRSGKVVAAETPKPAVGEGFLLVRNLASFVSVGTEKAALQFAKKSILGKALTRKDLLAKVVQKMRREGVRKALKAAFERLSEPLPLGYSACGVVEEVGEGVDEFRCGDIVACCGVGYACHAELINVPKNLAVKVPSGVEADEAAAVALGAIALEGVRVADLHVGEVAVVVGLGIVGQLAAQIAKAAGCVVFAHDPNTRRCEVVRRVAQIEAFDDFAALKDALFSRIGHGADAVLLAAATSSNEPIRRAPQLLHKRARVVVLGDVGLNIPRKPYYLGEHQVRFSCSYGPGRYERPYEEHGVQYRLEHVRWDERRNMEAFLRLVADGKVKVAPLIEERVQIDDAPQIYERLNAGEDLLGVVITYPRREEAQTRLPAPQKATAGAKFALIGAGGFGRTVLLPALLDAGAVPHIVCTAKPAKAATVKQRFGFANATCNPDEAINSSADFVVIATPHSTHADLLCKALLAHKPVFCEKPLAINQQQFKRVLETYRRTRTPFMVGFNRRFSEGCRRLRQKLPPGSPALLSYIVNAGPVEPDSWIADPREGGRIVGEVCHFVDTLCYLAGADIVEVAAFCPPEAGAGSGPANEAVIILRFADGSVGQILYSARGGGAAPKERIEVHRAGRIAVLEDFRRLVLFSERCRRMRLPADKGHRAEIQHFLRILRGEAPAAPSIRAACHTTAATLAILDAARSKTAVTIQHITLEDAVS